jgi:LUD domain
MRGLLFCVNLARKDKGAEPSAQLLQAREVPVRHDGDAIVRVLLGEGSPVELGTRGLILDVELPTGGGFASLAPPGMNGSVYMLEGRASIGASRRRVRRSEIAVLGREAVRRDAYLERTVRRLMPPLYPGPVTSWLSCSGTPKAHRQRSPHKEGQTMTTIQLSDRFTTLPDDQTLAATVVALEEHGFSVEVVDDLDAARKAVLARIPKGSLVMTNTSITLQETGIADAVNHGGLYESARNKMFALDFASQAQEMKAIGGQPDYALGSVHAVTRDGTLVIASASGSQLASYAWGAANVIFAVGVQKLVTTVEAAHERIYQHSLKLEDARAYAAYGQHSSVGKILEIHQELPGRIHVVLIRQSVGF